jgi:hypothetical protein
MWKVSIKVGSYRIPGEYIHLELPCDDVELNEKLDMISVGGQHDTYIADIEGFDYERITTYQKLNKFLKELKELDKDEETKEIIARIMLDEGYGSNEIIRTIEENEVTIVEVDQECPTELATKIDEEYLPQEVQAVPEEARWIIDWEQVGRVMICNEGYGFWSGRMDGIKRKFYYHIYR